MRNMIFRRERFFAAVVMVMALSSCAPSTPQWSAEQEKPKVFSVSFRQTAPEPVYNRARWVHLPEIVPYNGPDISGSPMLLPVVHLEFKNIRADEATRLVASLSKYSSYCASALADTRVSLNSLGTIDELAQELAGKVGAEAIVDHRNRHVSMVSRLPDISSPEAPRFSDAQSGSKSVLPNSQGLPAQVLGAEAAHEH